MAGNTVYVQGSYVDVHDNEVVNLSIDKAGAVHVGDGQLPAPEGLPSGEDGASVDGASVEVRVKACIEKLLEEKVLRHLYDYTWVMEVMNQTKDVATFNSPASFIGFLEGMGVERRPSDDTISKKLNVMTGMFPAWRFTDCDTLEANRRINVGKRFLSLFRKGQ